MKKAHIQVLHVKIFQLRFFQTFYKIEIIIDSRDQELRIPTIILLFPGNLGKNYYSMIRQRFL